MAQGWDWLPRQEGPTEAASLADMGLPGGPEQTSLFARGRPCLSEAEFTAPASKHPGQQDRSWKRSPAAPQGRRDDLCVTLLLAPRHLGRFIGNDAFMKPFQGSPGQRWQSHHLPLQMLLLPQKLPRRLHTHGRLNGYYNPPETGLSLGHRDSQPRRSHAQRTTSGSQRCGSWPHLCHRGGTQVPHLTGQSPGHPEWRIWPLCPTQPCQSPWLRRPQPHSPWHSWTCLALPGPF